MGGVGELGGEAHVAGVHRRRTLLAHLVQRAGFRVQGSGFRVQGSGFRVQGSGFRVQGPGFRVQGASDA